MSFPLKAYAGPLPTGQDPGAFGSIRKFDIHTGIDLYAPVGAEVLAIEGGEVVQTLIFTGPDAGSSWWHPTHAVIIKSASGYWLYGEILPIVDMGARICAGQVIGHVQQVLKVDKGRPMSMLHLELYNQPVNDGVIWPLHNLAPAVLVDPTPILQTLLKVKE